MLNQYTESVLPETSDSFASFDASTQASEATVIVPVAGENVLIAGEPWFLQADFIRQGPDLKLVGPDGQEVLILDYFSMDPPPDLVSANGATVKGITATHLAGPVAPGQYAQTTAEATAEPIGRVETAEGEIKVTHADGTESLLSLGDPIFEGDTLETGPASSVGIQFLDDSLFSLGEDGRMIMDEMVYDPSGPTGSAAISMLQGGFTFVSGQIAQTSVDAMTITTPTATIGIRGTAGGGNIGPDGTVTAALLPEAGGFVGELTFTNAFGTLTINQAGLAVHTPPGGLPPSQPFQMTAEQIGQIVGNALNATPGLLSVLDPVLVQGAQKGYNDQVQAVEAAQQAQADLEAAETAAAEAAAAEAEAAAALEETLGDPEATEEEIAAAEAAAADAAAEAADAEAAAADAEQQALEAEQAVTDTSAEQVITQAAEEGGVTLDGPPPPAPTPDGQTTTKTSDEILGVGNEIPPPPTQPAGETEIIKKVIQEKPDIIPDPPQTIGGFTSGNDTRTGGDGNDIFIMTSTFSTTGTETILGGIDTINGNGGTDTLQLNNLYDFKGVYDPANSQFFYNDGLPDVGTTTPADADVIHINSIERLQVTTKNGVRLKDDDGSNSVDLTTDTSGYRYIIVGTDSGDSLSISGTIAGHSVGTPTAANFLGGIIDGGAGDDTIIINSTLEGQNVDIYGGAGTDTLKIISPGTVTLTETIDRIETLYVDTATTVVASSAFYSGLTAINAQDVTTLVSANGNLNLSNVTTITNPDGDLTFSGAGSNDTIVGTNIAGRSDIIQGKGGNDTLTGGLGGDKFYYTGATAANISDLGHDTITDFSGATNFAGTTGQGDELWFNPNVVGTSTEIFDSVVWDGTNITSGVDNSSATIVVLTGTTAGTRDEAAAAISSTFISSNMIFVWFDEVSQELELAHTTNAATNGTETTLITFQGTVANDAADLSSGDFNIDDPYAQ